MLCGHILQDHSPSEVEDVKDKVKKEGHKGGKAFFYAIIPKDGKTEVGMMVVEIKINTCQIQPIKGW